MCLGGLDSWFVISFGFAGLRGLCPLVMGVYWFAVLV